MNSTRSLNRQWYLRGYMLGQMRDRRALAGEETRIAADVQSALAGVDAQVARLREEFTRERAVEVAEWQQRERWLYAQREQLRREALTPSVTLSGVFLIAGCAGTWGAASAIVGRDPRVMAEVPLIAITASALIVIGLLLLRELGLIPTVRPHLPPAWRTAPPGDLDPEQRASHDARSSVSLRLFTIPASRVLACYGLLIALGALAVGSGSSAPLSRWSLFVLWLAPLVVAAALHSFVATALLFIEQLVLSGLRRRFDRSARKVARQVEEARADNERQLVALNTERSEIREGFASGLALAR